jgi:predicted nucleic-acid-binding Zn-ribbon protein
MTGELRSYFGVSCARCGAPTLVSAKAVSLQDEIAQRETSAPRVFVARCMLCEYDSLYALSRVHLGRIRVNGEQRAIPRRRL